MKTTLTLLTALLASPLTPLHAVSATVTQAEAELAAIKAQLPFISLGDFPYHRQPRDYSEDGEVSAVWKSLMRLHSPRLMVADLESLSSHADPDIRALAMLGLVAKETPDVVPVCIRLMNDPAATIPEQSEPGGRLPGERQIYTGPLTVSDIEALMQLKLFTAAADANPKIVRRAVDAAIQYHTGNSGSWDRARAMVVLASLGDDSDRGSAVKWFFDEPNKEEGSSPQGIFIDGLEYRHPQQWRDIVGRIVAHPEFDRLRPIDVMYHASTPLKLSFSDDSSLLVSVGNDNRVFIWSVSEGEPANEFHGDDVRFAPVAFAPDAQSFFAASGHGLLAAYAVSDGHPRFGVRYTGNWIQAAAASADGKYL